MYRKLAKTIAWVSVVGTTYYLTRADSVIVWIATSLMALWSSAVLDRNWALRGDEKNPSMLLLMTVTLPLFAVTLLVGLPSILHDLGYYDSWRFDWVVTISAFFTGLMIAGYLWIPFLLYTLIDSIFNRLSSRHTSVPVP